ncbi:hypothetical protein MMC25_000176 [Agyrium rufum]|nr:hypothetical protein [Agyrium rufum]
MGIRVGSEPDTQYRIPECFGEDIFSILGSTRPDHRWLIVGPARSGSTFHKDPNATSAWNAVLSGSKYWIMFPPSSTADAPPGVFVSEDEAEVTTPQCIAEWLMNFHEEARMLPGCLEGICEAGEVLHVPSGWWHLVVNLSPTIAITQNFVPRAQLRHALHFLENKPSQVSGFKEGLGNPYALFVEKLKEHYPDLLDSVLQDIEQGKVGKKRKWEDLVKNDHDHDVNAPDGNRDSGFGFGFGDDDNEDIP